MDCSRISGLLPSRVLQGSATSTFVKRAMKAWRLGLKSRNQIRRGQFLPNNISCNDIIPRVIACDQHQIQELSVAAKTGRRLCREGLILRNEATKSFVISSGR